MDEKQFIAAMEHIVAALKERGYDPYSQLTGYVTENERTYIPVIKVHDSSSLHSTEEK